jgi:hypothetical protein
MYGTVAYTVRIIKRFFKVPKSDAENFHGILSSAFPKIGLVSVMMEKAHPRECYFFICCLIAILQNYSHILYIFQSVHLFCHNTKTVLVLQVHRILNPIKATTKKQRKQFVLRSKDMFSKN